MQQVAALESSVLVLNKFFMALPRNFGKEGICIIMQGKCRSYFRGRWEIQFLQFRNMERRFSL